MENLTLNTEFFDLFVQFMGNGESHTIVPNETAEEYKHVFMGAPDETDLVIEIWKNHGFSNYKNGLFSIVNPNEYNEIARKFPNISPTANVFAKSCVGGLFIFDNLPIGKSILYLNVHTGMRKVIGTSLEVLLGIEISADSFWKKECYGKTELKVIDKHGPLAYDECYAFVPALALGGSESIAKMQKVKVKEQLELLAQLY